MPVTNLVNIDEKCYAFCRKADNDIGIFQFEIYAPVIKYFLIKVLALVRMYYICV